MDHNNHNNQKNQLNPKTKKNQKSQINQIVNLLQSQESKILGIYLLNNKWRKIQVTNPLVRKWKDILNYIKNRRNKRIMILSQISLNQVV